MAAEKQVTAASRRRARLSGWVLSQSQITLAICGIVVGLLVSFGVGFLSGVWFQTRAQIVSRDEAIALADGQLDRERPISSPSPEKEMTFYSSLTSRDGTADSQSVPVSKSQEPVSDTSTSTPPPSSSQGTETVPLNEDPLPAAGMPAAEAQAVTSQEVEAGKAENADSVTLPAGMSQMPVAGEPSVAAEVPAQLEPGASREPTPEEPAYSVQVGSFRRVEQAYQLQDQLIKKGYQARIGLSMLKGHGAWYRVRVGRYPDRNSADKTAQRLQENEKMDVIVMRDSS